MPDDLNRQIRDYVDEMSLPVTLDDITRSRRASRRRRPAIVIVAALVVAGAISLAIANRHHPQRLVVAPATNTEPPKTPNTDPLHLTTLRIPQLVSPSVVIQSTTSVYTLTYSELRADPLARFDTRTHRLAATTSLSRAQDIALGSSGLFALRAPPISAQGTAVGPAEVDVLSLDTLHVERTFALTTPTPLRIAVVGDAVWVMGFDGVNRYDASSGRPLGSVDLRAERCPAGPKGYCVPLLKVSPYDMTVDPNTGRIFIAWEDGQNLGVTEFGADAMPVTEGFPMARSRVGGMSAARNLTVGDHVLFVESDDAKTAEWRVFNSADLSTRPGATIQGSTRLALQPSGGSVWAVDQYRSSLSCVDPRSGQTRWRTSVDNPVAVAAVDRELFVFTATSVELADVPASCSSTRAPTTGRGSRTTAVASALGNSGCASRAFSPPRWPKSGTLASVAAAGTPAIARRFVATELGIADVAALSGLKVSESACTVPVRVGTLEGTVNFIAVSKQRYAVEGFNLGAIGGGSIQVTGRHVDVSYAPQCGVCTSWEMHVRYGDVVASVGSARSSHMTADLTGDPSVSGGYVLIDRLANGAIRSAHASTIPPGNFAAS